MMHSRALNMLPTVDGILIEDSLVDATWVICSTYHTILKATPGAAIFGRDILFDIPFIAL